MKVRAVLTMAALAGFCPHGAAARPAPMGTIAVCTDHDGKVPVLMLIPAVMTATRLFGEIGVRLNWTRPDSCPPDGIRISLTRNAPDTFHPGAMAYAWLARKQIEVFLGRIERSSQGLQPHLLGYVLVHEITHVIQGVDRHSADGVMKAHWDWRDLARIEGNALRFKKDDVELIFIGLERQHARLPAAETRVELSMAGGSPQPANLQK